MGKIVLNSIKKMKFNTKTIKDTIVPTSGDQNNKLQDGLNALASCEKNQYGADIPGTEKGNEFVFSGRDYSGRFEVIDAAPGDVAEGILELEIEGKGTRYTFGKKDQHGNMVGKGIKINLDLSAPHEFDKKKATIVLSNIANDKINWEEEDNMGIKVKSTMTQALDTNSKFDVFDASKAHFPEDYFVSIDFA